MPLGYFVQANGRTGARLRVARGTHELVATGPAARLGTLIPHYTTTTTITADGRPLEVHLPFLLALWLVLGCLVPSDDMLDLFVLACFAELPVVLLCVAMCCYMWLT